MLHSKILPQGMGHTTCCFLSVEGGSETGKYFMTEEGQDRFPVEDLNDVGHALSKGNSKLKEMGQDSLCKLSLCDY
jgi:mitofusin